MYGGSQDLHNPCELCVGHGEVLTTSDVSCVLLYCAKRTRVGRMGCLEFVLYRPMFFCIILRVNRVSLPC